MIQEYTDPKRQDARQSFTGKRMTESQFDEAWNITGIINREIHKSGSFIDKLTDYAHAYSRNQKFDGARGEVILRDLYSARYGESMNQTRTALMEREDMIRETAQDQALHHARSIGKIIQNGPTMPFYQAADNAGVAMAHQHGITETGAKKLMAEAFEAAEGRSLRDHGKELESTYHIPVRDAERAARQATRSQMQRSGPSI